MFRKILLCSDGSESSLKAARAAAEIAGRGESELIALHVTQVSVAPVGVVGGIGMEAGLFNEPRPEVGEAIARRTAAALEATGAPFRTRREIGLSPADVIVRIAEEESADLIVLGSHGAGAVERFLLGSVSDRVAHHAHCAVLIVK